MRKRRLSKLQNNEQNIRKKRRMFAKIAALQESASEPITFVFFKKVYLYNFSFKFFKKNKELRQHLNYDVYQNQIF